MLTRIFRGLAPRAAAPAPPAPVPDQATLRADLAGLMNAAQPAYPAGFRGAVPPRWYDKTHEVRAIQDWLAAQRTRDPAFDAVAFLRDFAEIDRHRAAPFTVLALEHRAAGDKQAAAEAIAASLSANHWDLHAQDIALEINAWAAGAPSPLLQLNEYLKGRFCAAPFETLETTPNGDAYVCCPSWLPIPIGNIDRQDADAIWNSPIADELRASILDGSFRYCSRMHCSRIGNKWLPEAGSPEAAAFTAGDALRKPGPRQVILSHDQSCNLACPSCRRDFILANKEEQAALDRVADDFVMPILRDADSVRITGSGDPFGSNHFRRLLKSITREEFPRLWVDLHTNAQLLNARAWADLGLSSLVRITEISIDAALPETYAVVRRGGDFSRLLENLEFVKHLRETGEIQRLVLSFVVQALNFREMPEFVRIADRFGADLVVFNMIRNWGTYSREEFEEQFIGARTHPEHGAFLETLRAPELQAAKVSMGNVLGYA